MSTYVRGRGQEGHGAEGVTGLKSLGVRDLTYRLAFLATTVTPTDLQVDWLTHLPPPPCPLPPHIHPCFLSLPSCSSLHLPLLPCPSPSLLPSLLLPPSPSSSSPPPLLLPSLPMQFGSGQPWGNDVTVQQMQASFSTPEWQKVFEMSQDSNLYQNLITSMFPTIHGQWGWGGGGAAIDSVECVPAAIPRE